jgi:hypothetical protein
VNPKNRGVWVLVALASGLAFFCLSSLAGGEEELVTLVGTVIEVEWDEEGNISAVDLVTDDGTFVIDLQGVGAGLLAQVGESVEVVGTVYEDHYGLKVLVVSYFTVLPADEQ